MLEHVALLEHLLASCLARGRADIDAMAAVLQHFHRPAEPLLPTPLHLRSLVWALEALPPDLGTQDTLWVSGEEVLAGPRGELSRLGPTEWAAAGTYVELRRTALACAVLVASSRALRESLIGEDVDLYDIPDDRAMLARLAFSLRVDPNELLLASERLPAFVNRLLKLAAQPWHLQVKTRGISLSSCSPRAAALWRDLLQALASMNPDGRKVAVWLAPVWITDVVSPYVRDVKPLLEKWALSQPGLKSFARLIGAGDEDAMYLCANLLSANEPAVDQERETNEAGVGIISIRDAQGIRLARLVDTLQLDASMIDPRIGEAGADDMPLVIVLEESDPDTGYALQRLLCDVRADFASVRINATGMAAPDVEQFVARARVAEAPLEPVVFATTSRQSDALPSMRALSLPDITYLELFDPWSGQRDFAFEAHRAQQGPLVAALLRGDFDPAHIVQTFWLDASDDRSYLASKRAHIADAIAQWQELLGKPPHKPQKPERSKDKVRDVPSTFRFRV